MAQSGSRVGDTAGYAKHHKQEKKKNLQNKSVDSDKNRITNKCENMKCLNRSECVCVCLD